MSIILPGHADLIWDPKVVYYSGTEPLGPGKVVNVLRGMNITCEKRNLNPGDYWVVGVAIERKADTDYIASIKDGRLKNQLYKLSVAYPLSILIIEGSVLMAQMESNLHSNSFWSSRVGDFLKQSAEGEQGVIHMLETPTPSTTALVIRFVREKMLNPAPRIFRPPRIKYSPDQMAIYVVGSIPGIGPERARRLLEKYGTPRNVFLSDDWREIHGIGDKLNVKAQMILDMKYDS